MSLVNYISFVICLAMLSTDGPGGKTLLFICHHSSTGNLVYSAMEFFRLSCRSGGKIMPLSAQVHFPPPNPSYATSSSYTRTIIGPSLSFLSCVLYLQLSFNSSFFLLPIVSSSYLKVQSPLLYVHNRR